MLEPQKPGGDDMGGQGNKVDPKGGQSGQTDPVKPGMDDSKDMGDGDMSDDKPI